MNILFTCAGRRNYLINYFKEALDGKGEVFASDMQLTAPSLVDADKSFKVSSIYNETYIDELKKISVDNGVDAIISLNDLELPILANHKEDFLSIGVKVIISSKEVIDISFDKWKTVEFLLKCGLKTPKTFIDLNKAKEAIDNKELTFPVVVKPRWGSASISVDFAHNLEELELIYQLQKIKLKESILIEASKHDISSAILIQQKILGKEYGIDILNDFNGKYYSTFAREKLSMRSGETDKAISVIDEDISMIGKTLGENLKHIGNLDCDVFFDGESYFVLELNPRFGGGYPFSHEAGINTPAIYINWLKGINEIKQFNNFESDIAFAKCDRLLNVSDTIN
jgi:carbamoyl-phosphate synthase large subunit